MACEKASLSVYITDDEEIRELNRRWLGRDRPTDVMAWSQLEGPPMPGVFMGDVVISFETAKRQAAELGHDVARELDRLVVHGVLHLAGFDHVHGGRQAARMRKMEQKALDLIAALEED